jgi:PmbA protein
LEDILALAKKVAQEAEVFLTSYEETPVVFEANRLKQLQTRQGRAVALRIIREGKIGFSTTTRLDDIKALVDRAVEVSQFGAPARFELPPRQAYPPVEVHDPEVETFAIEEMVELGESLIARLRRHTPELVCEGGVTRGITSIHILNSKGGEATYKRSLFAINIEGTLIQDTDMLFVGDTDSSCHPIRNVDKLADSVIEQLELAKRQSSVPSGQLPVVFTPHGAFSAFIASLASAFNGRVVAQGASPLGSKQGEQVFDKKLSLWDDPTIAYHPRSRPCDDEGVSSQRTSLIDNGVVESFLYDLQTASLLRTQSTGNGDRGLGGLPTPSISALVFGQGNVTFADMVRDVRLGLVIEQLMGAEQTNVLGGEFSGNVLLGYKVENGEIVGRVKNTVVSGNVYKVLDNLTAIGHEARWVGGLVYAPAFYCSSLAVASKG